MLGLINYCNLIDSRGVEEKVYDYETDIAWSES